MKTVQFHRNKQELRNQLLSFLNVDKSKSKLGTKKVDKKGYNNSKEKHSNRSQSRQLQKGLKQVSAKDFIKNQVLQQPVNTNNGLKIKLKLKKKTQNQMINNNTNKLLQPQPQLYHSPLQQVPPNKQLNSKIKRAIQKQLLQSFYSKQLVTKQIDNRRTAYRQQQQQQQQQNNEQNNIISISQQQEQQQQTISHDDNYVKQNRQRNSSTVRTKERQQRCSRIKQQRVNNSNKMVMVNSFNKGENNQYQYQQQQQYQYQQECDNAHVITKHNNLHVDFINKPIIKQSIKQSMTMKFIPEDEVHIPKSFVTFTVKRRQQQNLQKSTTSEKGINTSNKYHYPYYQQKHQQPLERIKTQTQIYTQTHQCNKQQNNKKNRSLSSIQQFHYGCNDNNQNQQLQLQKKMAFYDRHNSINTNKNINNNNKNNKLIAKSSSSHSLKKQSSILKTIKSVNNKTQTIQYKQQQKQNIIQIKQQLSTTKNIPLVKMTQSLYQDKYEQRMGLKQKCNEPSLSLTSSLNYSTPFPSLQQSESKQLTINKLSTITKQPQHQRRIMHSLSIEQKDDYYNDKNINKDDQSKLLRFSQQKEEINMKNNIKNNNSNSNDLLTMSLTKFKQYEQRKEQILKLKSQSMKNGENIKLIKSQISLSDQLKKQEQKQEQQFNDFDQIFLQSNQLDNNINDANQLNQRKKPQKKHQQQQLSSQKQHRKKQKTINNETKLIQKDFNQNQKNKYQPNNVITIQKLQQVNVKPSNNNNNKQNKMIKDKQLQQQYSIEQQKQKDQSIELPPPQLSINQSSIIQQSVSDFTSQSSLAEIKFNDQSLLKINDNLQNVNGNSNEQKQKQIHQRQQQKQQLIKPPFNNIITDHQDQQKKYKQQSGLQKQKQQQQKQLSSQKSQLSLNQFQDYQFKQSQQQKLQINNQNNKTNKDLYFDDFPQWKYNDNRDNAPESFIRQMRQNQNKQLRIISWEMKQDSNNPQLQIQPQSETIPLIKVQTNQPLKVDNQIIKPKSTTTLASNKVRLIQNIQLSSSSSSQSEKQSYNNHDDDNKDKESQTKPKQSQKLKQLLDEEVQNRYYSSSDQQQQHQSSSLQTKNYLTLTKNNKQQQKPQRQRQPTKLTLKKQTSMKKTFNNNNTNNQQKTQQQKTKQKVIPLGIKVTKPKDLFPVLEDSQQWNYGSQSVAEIQTNSIVQNDNKIVNQKKENQNNNQKPHKQKQKQSIQKDEQLDMLQKQFSQPLINSKKSKEISSNNNNKKITIKKQSISQRNNKSLSDFSSSSQHRDDTSNNLTQSLLSDFSQNQSLQNYPQTVDQKNDKKNHQNLQSSNKPILNPIIPPALTTNNELNEIKKQRTIVHDLKNHVNQLLKRISSQQSISSSSQSKSKQDNHNVFQPQNQKQNHSFLSNNQPSIKPVSMSFESQGSLANDRESFVEQYEENNVKESIVRSKHQQSRKSKQKNNNLYKKYEKDSNKRSQQLIENNPLFDFSDKNSSDHQVQQQNDSSVKQYSQHQSSQQSLSYKKSSSNSQTSLEQKNKQDVLRQFDIFAGSKKDFSKNKGYYLKHKEKDGYKQNQKMFDNGVGNDLPILMPKAVKKDGESTKMRQSSEYHSNKDKKLTNKNRDSPSQQGSSGQTINHKQLEIIPQSLYVTNAKNTSSNQLKLSQMQPRQSLKHKKGLSVSKKISSNSNEQLNSSSGSGLGKSFNNNGSSGSGVMNMSQSEHNYESTNVEKQKVLENQFLWNFIMKK